MPNITTNHAITYTNCLIGCHTVGVKWGFLLRVCGLILLSMGQKRAFTTQGFLSTQV